MNLNFDSHISNIVHKISKTIRIISKIRYYLLEKALLKSTFPTYLKKLTTLQNRADRYTVYTDAAKFCHSALPYHNRLRF